MKASELLKLLTDYAERHKGSLENLEVVVATEIDGIPHEYLSKVEFVRPGFDWTARYLIISTADNLVPERKLEKPLADVARERLDWLKTNYDSIGQKYILKAREQEWLDGFEEGAQMHFTRKAQP